MLAPMSNGPLFEDKSPRPAHGSSPPPLRLRMPARSTFPDRAALEDVKRQLAATMIERGHQQLEILHDPEMQIAGFVCIHSTKRGPALGGLRFRQYDSALAAGEDVLNLAEGMSLKALAADLPLGGGKAVLIKPDRIDNTEAYFERVGELLHQVCPNGAYITAEDMGTDVTTLGIIKRRYPFVVGLEGGAGDPSPWTALGVLKSIKAVNREILGNSSLEGITVAIEGVGNVGMQLARFLHKRGAKLIVADIDQQKALKAANSFDATIVAPEEILRQKCDILAPCAIGGVIRADNVQQIRAAAIVGAANNIIQGEDPEVHWALYNQGTFYAQDFFANAGGLCRVPLDITDDLKRKLLKHDWKQIETIKDTSFLGRIRKIPIKLMDAVKQTPEGTPPSLHMLKSAKEALDRAA